MTLAHPPLRPPMVYYGGKTRLATRANVTKLGAQTLDCRMVLTQPATGRRRRFCGAACRVRAHRAGAPQKVL